MSSHLLSQEDVPDSWSRDCPEKGTKVEIAVQDPTEDSLESPYSWVEIPTSHVEMWESKGGSDGPAIKKTCKFKFPTTWDGRDVRSIVSGYASSELTVARVSLKDESGNWVLDFCGYIGGVGGTENSLESKAWIYDFTERFEGIGITQSYNFPTAKQVISDMASELRENLIPLTNVLVLPPNGEGAYLRNPTQLSTGDTEPQQGSSYYGYDLSEDTSELDGSAEITDVEVDTGFQVPFGEEASDAFFATLNPVAAVSESTRDFLTSSVATAVEWLYKNTDLGQKKFTRNHDTVGDVLNWLSGKTNLQWHFEPVPNGTVLVITSGTYRRIFAQDKVVSDVRDGEFNVTNFALTGDTEYLAHEQVTVRQNQALYESSVANTVIVRGDTARSALEDKIPIGDTGEELIQTFNLNEYPVVKARANSLYEAAGNTELSLAVESDATTIDEAEAVAYNELQNAFEQSSEGKITLDGSPRMLPFDVIDAYEVCDRYVTEQIPVRYEIEEIKHTDSMTSTLETTVNVQPFVAEQDIDIIDSSLQEIDQ